MNINGMEHTPSQKMVFQSADYNKFNMIRGNRGLDMNKIKRILADIERGCNLLKYCPVLVVENNNHLDIIDGQHRFAVAKKIKSPVFYIIAESLSLYDIARMNSNTEKWKVDDFINCYCEHGNKNYIRLKEVLKEHAGLTPTNAIALLSNGKVVQGSYADVMEKFHRGEFMIKQEEQALTILNLVNAFELPSKYSRHFIMAVEKVLSAELYDIGELTKKVNDNLDMISSEDHWRKYLTSMEEIVSKGKHKRVAIY